MVVLYNSLQAWSAVCVHAYTNHKMAPVSHYSFYLFLFFFQGGGVLHHNCIQYA